MKTLYLLKNFGLVDPRTVKIAPDYLDTILIGTIEIPEESTES